MTDRYEPMAESNARADSLKEMIAQAMERFNALSPEEQAEHRRQQRESYVRAEMSWPEPKFEMKMIDGVMTKVYASFEDYCNG
jgi:hypothetical protein